MAKRIPVLILSTFYFSTYSTCIIKVITHQKYYCAFFPEDQYTRSYKYRMKAMDKMTELGRWEIKITEYRIYSIKLYPQIKATLNWTPQMKAIINKTPPSKKMPHLMKRMRHLIKDNEKKLSTTWYIVIYTIQTITILSQQNKRHWNLFKQYIIFKKRFTVTVVRNLRKVISKQIPPSNKCPPYINAASETLKI